ncbi:MAG: ABC transporter ATP-binding protein [Desulfobacterales bacterium]|nr:ABC transporter ATP-binding protein [Desulfobacterales bacterium]
MFNLSDIQMRRNGKNILSIKTLDIPTDRFTIIIGHNGSGKSTLANLLSGQQKPDAGKIRLNSRDIGSYGAKELARSVAFLPQRLPESVGLTVRELVRMGRFAWRGTFGRWNRDDERIIDESIKKTGVGEFSHILTDRLSGGERQRAWVAMLLAQKAPVLILDEPTSALDVHHQYQLMNLLATLNQTQNGGIIIILHDLNLTLRYASHIIALKKGRIAFQGPVDGLLNEQRLSDLYQAPIRLIPHPDWDSRTGKVAVICV